MNVKCHKCGKEFENENAVSASSGTCSQCNDSSRANNAPIDDGGPAFPFSLHPNHGYNAIDSCCSGMTLRDWFAGQATDADVAFYFDSDSGMTRADARYMHADAMLKARAAK